ncbi:hypothetical protein P7K49_021692 [Saguinus oedipus]|uniref:Uncharacterized protein n=1 Tax=Saguinus oedipus TaxID=9490 RepID=A0ABQ9UU67_SAGOE|nr:hypothetical protein P7K49_021692 [Saguinus oedipus]
MELPGRERCPTAKSAAQGPLPPTPPFPACCCHHFCSLAEIAIFTETKMDQADGPREPPQSARRKRSYKQAVSELDEDQHLEDEELQPPRSKTPSSPCPASKVVRPLRTFLHTVQRNQMLMTPTSAPRSVMKSFIKRNTPLRVDPKVRGLCPGWAWRELGSVAEGPVYPLRYWE